MITDPKLKNDRFSRFYSQSFTSKSNVTDLDVDVFLNIFDIPVLSKAVQLDIKADFTREETEVAKCSFPNGEACSPDGFRI